MTIKYLGHAAFLLKSKDGRLVTDPFDPTMVGLKFPKTEADIVTVSHGHQDHNATSQVTGGPLVIDWPGEFEKIGFRITGFKHFHDKEKGKERGENILYKIESEGLSVLHCGDLGVVPDDEFLDQVGEVDILLVPVGGFYTINSDEAVELVKKIEPQIVIPMHYGRRELNPKTFKDLTDVEEFVKKIGIEPGRGESQLTVKKEDLEGEIKAIVMEINP